MQVRDEYKEKLDYVKAIKAALILDDRSELMDITYQTCQVNDRSKREIVTLYFLGRSTVKINVTGFTRGAIYLEIGRAIYGGGAICEIQEGK